MNSHTLLYRQVHPTHVIPHRNALSSAVFMPERKGSNAISTYNGDLISAEDALEHYRSTVRGTSIGVVGLTVGVFEQRDMHAIHDSKDYPEHVTVTYPEGVSENQRRKIARTLAALATTWFAQ